MKIDIHNHILPKEWPNLKEVGYVIPYYFTRCIDNFKKHFFNRKDVIYQATSRARYMVHY